MGTIDKHALVEKLFKIKSGMWSTSPEAATIDRVLRLVNKMDCNAECSYRKIEFGYLDYCGWTQDGKRNLYKCHDCGYETTEGQIEWCPMCGRCFSRRAKDEVIENTRAVRERKRIENERLMLKPIPLEQLKKSVGRPVYIEDRYADQDCNRSVWAIVNDPQGNCTNNRLAFMAQSNENASSICCWRAWPTKPTMAEREAVPWLEAEELEYVDVYRCDEQEGE